MLPNQDMLISDLDDLRKAVSLAVSRFASYHTDLCAIKPSTRTLMQQLANQLATMETKLIGHLAAPPHACVSHNSQNATGEGLTASPDLP